MDGLDELSENEPNEKEGGYPMICDAQVHTPAVAERPERADPPNSWAGSIGKESLSSEMAAAGVDRAVLVPVDGRVDECLEWSRQEPGQYTVVAPLPPDTCLQSFDQVLTDISLLMERGCRGVRISCFTEEDIERFDRGDMDVVFRAAEALEVPFMILAASRLGSMHRIAEQFPGLKLCIDHMGIIPRHKYPDFGPLLSDLLPLADFPNVVVKLTQIIRAVDESFPYPGLHQPIQRVVDAFGPHRAFWGSDLTVYPNPYPECVELFRLALAGLSHQDLNLVMGDSICSWLSWP